MSLKLNSCTFILHSSKRTIVNMKGLHFNVNLNNVVLKEFTTSKGGCLGMLYKFFFSIVFKATNDSQKYVPFALVMLV